jgi:hypothetical protein
MTLKPPQILAPRSAVRAQPIVNALETEIFEEKAATLGRLTRAFESALAAWRDAEPRAESGGEASEMRRARLFDAAADALWHFVVQREACGLRNTEAVLREYKVPPALRLRMGAIRRGEPR